MQFCVVLCWSKESVLLASNETSVVKTEHFLVSIAHRAFAHRQIYGADTALPVCCSSYSGLVTVSFNCFSNQLGAQLRLFTPLSRDLGVC